MPIKMSRDWRLKRRTIRHPSFDEDEHIVIKAYYGDHDRQRVASASTEYRRDEETGQMMIVATLDKLHALKREIAVVSWNIKDEDGFPLPFSKEVLLALPSDIAAWLDEEINKDWENLGEPVASAEDAAAQEQAEKERRSTFHGDSLRAAGGGAPDSRPDDGAGAGSARRRHSETTSA